MLRVLLAALPSAGGCALMCTEIGCSRLDADTWPVEEAGDEAFEADYGFVETFAPNGEQCGPICTGAMELVPLSL